MGFNFVSSNSSHMATGMKKAAGVTKLSHRNPTQISGKGLKIPPKTFGRVARTSGPKSTEICALSGQRAARKKPMAEPARPVRIHKR